MKKVLWTVLVMGVVGYFVYAGLANRNAKIERKIEISKETKAIQDAVAAMVQRNGAIGDWPNQLANNDPVKFGPIMTIDLERLWLGNQPILFTGTFQDIKTLDGQNYGLSIDRSVITKNLFIGTDMKLELRADKRIVDAFLLKWPQVKDSDTFDKDVAFIAKIANIKSGKVPTEDGSTDQIITGEGQLLDMLFAGTIDF